MQGGKSGCEPTKLIRGDAKLVIQMGEPLGISRQHEEKKHNCNAMFFESQIEADELTVI